ncbi:MAG TPA: Gfo/Idh/MocA family oxidoreductase [Verrucomicrobiae bacterium]|nr:Gfo/Idh/MocA family oxidoreductase [Verrucomicrobiae bacterium]
MSMSLHVAFAGFRHGHIFDLLERCRTHAGVEVVAMGEENYDASLMPSKNLEATHSDIAAMIARSGCNAVAIGDCYGRRAAIAIAALRAGKHVISDKPLCISLKELETIRGLAANGGPRVGVMFDLRDSAAMRTLREVVRAGRIGEPQTVCFAGQHPLLLGTRPSWYFEPGMHGGTINDIGVHAIDLIPWLTGKAIEGVVGARAWNAKAKAFPHFRDCAQFQLRLAGGGGVIGDVSYLGPDGCGFKLPNYWRVTVHGTAGFAETSYGADAVRVAGDDAKEPESVLLSAGRPGGYLEDFLADIAGSPAPDGLTTTSVFEATRWALETQRLADG